MIMQCRFILFFVNRKYTFFNSKLECFSVKQAIKKWKNTDFEACATYWNSIKMRRDFALFN